MDCIRAPSIRVYSRGIITDHRGGSATRPLVSYDSEDEAEVTRVLPQQQDQVRFRVEDDLNWTSKYLSIDRGSSTPGTRRSGGVSPVDYVRAPSPATGKYFGSPHSEDSGIFGSRSSIGGGGGGGGGGRLKSPSTFSENSEYDVIRGGATKRHSTYQHNDPLNFRIGDSSPIFQGSQTTTRNGYMNLGDVGGNIRATSPSMSRPVTRTYDDLERSRPTQPSTSPYMTLNNTADTARTFGGFDVSTSGARFHSNVGGGSGSRARISTDSNSRSETNNSKKTKRPVSETRKKLRSILCRTRNDPRYFDDDY